MGRLLGHLKDLSKAFDCLPSYLFIAKLKACDFDNNSLKLVHENLSRRFQRTKIGNECSSWKEICWCSVGFFNNIHSCDLLFIIDKFSIVMQYFNNYNITRHISSVVKLLQKVAITIFQWFKDNEMKVNADKCHQEY